MKDAGICKPTPQARWDGRRVLFEVRYGEAQVSCAISPGSLSELASRRCFRPGDALACFAADRLRIEAIALAKLRARPIRGPGPLTIWSDDVEDYVEASGAASRAAL